MNIQKLLAPLSLFLLYIFFSFFGRNFFSYNVLINILDSSYYIGFLAIGVTFVIIGGGIDLSCGTVMMAAIISGGVAYKNWGWPMAVALLVPMVVALIFGFLNGFLVAKLRLPPFIATLGTMLMAIGFSSTISNVSSVTFPVRDVDGGWFKSLFKIVNEEGNTLPSGLLLLLLVSVIAHVVLFRTKVGRYICALGSNKEAARLAGVKVAKWEMATYLISGFCAGLGGIAFAAVYTTIQPGEGQGFELYAIAGAVIGGCSLTGGVGTIFGSLIGVYIMSVLRSGLPSMNIQSHYQIFFTGVVVIAAVLLDIYRNKKLEENKKKTLFQKISLQHTQEPEVEKTS